MSYIKTPAELLRAAQSYGLITRLKGNYFKVSSGVLWRGESYGRVDKVRGTNNDQFSVGMEMSRVSTRITDEQAVELGLI